MHSLSESKCVNGAPMVCPLFCSYLCNHHDPATSTASQKIPRNGAHISLPAITLLPQSLICSPYATKKRERKKRCHLLFIFLFKTQPCPYKKKKKKKNDCARCYFCVAEPAFASNLPPSKQDVQTRLDLGATLLAQLSEKDERTSTVTIPLTTRPDPFGHSLDN